MLSLFFGTSQQRLHCRVFLRSVAILSSSLASVIEDMMSSLKTLKLFWKFDLSLVTSVLNKSIPGVGREDDGFGAEVLAVPAAAGIE